MERQAANNLRIHVLGKMFMDLTFTIVIPEFCSSTEQTEEQTCYSLCLQWEELYGEVTELFEQKAKTHLSSENPNAIPCRQMHFQLRLRFKGG